MWFKHRAWIPVAWFLSVANLAAVWFAARPAEPWHATGHALLAVAFALGARHLMARRRTDAQYDDAQQTIAGSEHAQQVVEDLQPRLQELEERLDFAERLLTQHRDAERRDAPPR